MNIQAMRSFLMTGFDKNSELNAKNVGLILLACVCTILPLDISQLAFAVIGALAYALLQVVNPRPVRSKQIVVEYEAKDQRGNGLARSRPQQTSWRKDGAPRVPREQQDVLAKANADRKRVPSPPVAKPEVYKPSSMPVSAPTFSSTGWDDEVSELLQQLTPGNSEAQAVRRLALHVEQVIKAIYPDVEVSGFAHAGLSAGKAFAIAVPEVDIVANISPTALAARIAQNQRQQLDVKKFQKTSVRLCTDRLVANAGLKFRRSAFRGEEPRVTLLVPPQLGFFSDAVPIDFSINTVTPFYTAALLTECGQIDLRAKSLILLVKRWAKDRGICHAAKGHLSPYLWSLLAMYFLQVGVDEEGAILPSLDQFKISSTLGSGSSKAKGATPAMHQKGPQKEEVNKLSVGQLFGKFVHFYSKKFNWSGEAISIGAGRRAAPDLSVPLHVVINDDGTSAVGPIIADPFKAGNNLGNSMNPISLARLHEELSRANDLYQRGASLTELLQPWVPVEDVQEISSGSSPENSTNVAAAAQAVSSA